MARTILVEGIDYTVEGIESVRQELIEMRAYSFKEWPSSIRVTLVLTHAIALLARMQELIKEGTDDG